MMVVCEATQSADEQLQVAAYECLVRIMQLYYDNMLLYMEKALFAVSCATEFTRPSVSNNLIFYATLAAHCCRNEQRGTWCCAASH